MIPERAEIKLQRFAFHQPALGHVVDHEMREVGLSRHGAERGELRAGESHDIKRVGLGIGDLLQNGTVWRLRALRRAAALRERPAGGLTQVRPSVGGRGSAFPRRLPWITTPLRYNAVAPPRECRQREQVQWQTTFSSTSRTGGWSRSPSIVRR